MLLYLYYNQDKDLQIVVYKQTILALRTKIQQRQKTNRKHKYIFETIRDKSWHTCLKRVLLSNI